MIRPFTCVCMILAAGSGLYVYQTKHRGQMLDKEIARTLKTADAVRQRITILKSEWAVLNEPDHLAELGRSHLALRTTATSQLAALSDLGTRLPAPLPPGTSSAPTDMGEDSPVLPPLPAPVPVAARPSPVRVAAATPHPAPAASAPAVAGPAIPVQALALPTPPANHTAPGSSAGPASPVASVQVASLPTPSASHPAARPVLRTPATDHTVPMLPPEHAVVAQAGPRLTVATVALPANAAPVAALPAPVRPHIMAPVVSVAASPIPAPARPAPSSAPAIPASQAMQALGTSALGGTRAALPAPVPYTAQASR